VFEFYDVEEGGVFEIKDAAQAVYEQATTNGKEPYYKDERLILF